MRSEDEERLRAIAIGYFLAHKMGVKHSISLEDNDFLDTMWKHERDMYNVIVREAETEMGIKE